MPHDPQIEAILNNVDSKRIEAHRRYEQEQSRKDNLFTRLGDYPIRPERFIIDGFLPDTSLVVLAADPKMGKTAFASALALAVAKGKPFAGMNCKQRSVLWLALEETYQERGSVMRFARGTKNIPFYVTYQRIPIDTPEGINDLDYWIRATNAGLIVVDPLHAAHSGRSLTDGWAARKTLVQLKELCEGSRATALVLHHLSKRGAIRVAESVQLSAIATMTMILNAPSLSRKDHAPNSPSLSRRDEEGAGGWSQKRPRIVTLQCSGRGAFANRTWEFLSRGPLDYQRNFAVPAIPELPPLAVKILTKLAASPMSAAQLAVELGVTAQTARNTITLLRSQSRIRCSHKTGSASFYKLIRKKQ